MANRKHLINVHTSTGTQAPTGASLYLGEIAVQHTPNEPAIWIKMGSADTSTEYEKFIGETEILSLLEETKILGSGYTYSGLSYIDSSTTIADAFSALTNELIKDEKVTAAAINELNVKTNEINSVKQIIREDEEVTAGAINLLNERVAGVETHMTGDYIQITGYELASGSTEEELTLREEDTVDEAFGKLQKQMLDNEEAIAAGLNDLNNKVEDLEEQIEHSTGVTQLSGAVMSLSAATEAGFDEMYQYVREGLNEKADYTELEALSAGTVHDIAAVSAKTAGILTLNLNGVEQGQYCPSASTVIDLEAIQEITGADVLLTGYELASGSTEEELVVLASDTVNEAFGKLQKQNYDNEAVVAGALNDLDERVAALEEGGSVEPLSAATIALSAATVTLSSSTNADIQAISADTIELSAATVALSAASEDFFDGAEYISSAKTIVFKHGDVEKVSIDATEFIKDGMVSAVTISGGSMIISFNTDAGREDIELELTDIFDPDNYYTKDDINDGVSASTLELSAATIEVESGLTILSGAVEDMSYVVAQSLNDLSSKENALSAGTVAAIADLEDKIDELSGNTGISELSAATIEVKNDLATLSGITEEVADNLDTLSGVVIDTSYVVAQSLNDLNRKVDALSGNTGLSELSAATVDIKSGLEALSGEVISLSSVTESISGLVADNKDNIEELSAATIDIESDLETLSGVTEEVADGLETLSGVTEEISDNLETLSGVVIDNELVTAEALISLNNKIAELSGNTGINELSAATVSIKNDLETLSGVTEEVADGLETLSGAVIDMSYVVAMSLNDLSSKENALSAGTVAAIADLEDKIDELSANTVFEAGTGTNSAVLKGGNNLAGDFAVAEGSGTTASGSCSHAEGYQTQTGGADAVNTKTAGDDSNAGSYAHAEGNSTIAAGANSHAEGKRTLSYGKNSHAEGFVTKATGINSHAEGNNTLSSANASHAEGTRTMARGTASHSSGAYTAAGDAASVAMGSNSYAKGACSCAIGLYGTGTWTLSLTGAANATTYTYTAGTGLIPFYNDLGEARFCDMFIGNMIIDGTLPPISITEFVVSNVSNNEISGTLTTETTLSSTAVSNKEYSIPATVALSNNLAVGGYAIADGALSHAEGWGALTFNTAEHAEGKFNISINGVTQHTVGIGTLSTRKNAHLITTDGKHYIPGVGGYVGTETSLSGKQDLATVVNSKVPMTETTWSALKSLRDSSGLTPGKQYRITDYNTTTSKEDTRAAGHQFDIIVVADSANKLNENARAVLHNGDTYFSTSGANLNAWEIKYSLDNDTTRFAWAVTGATGRGVIYYMKDEWNNECPYDFKNIQFKVGAKTQPGTVADVYYYTFSVATGTNDATVTDHSLNGVYCYGNKIGVYINSSKQTLPSNVFRNTSATSNCNNNTFGNSCTNNTFGNLCSSNAFGNDCQSNTFGNSCSNNAFGNGCQSNTFKTGCYFNVFGNCCMTNSFSGDCNSNTFGNNCLSNTFGNSSYYNSFGNHCQQIIFNKDYVQNVIIENGNQYITLTSTQNPASSTPLRNITIAQGVNNSTTRKTISHNTLNDTFKTTYQSSNSQTINI